MGEIAFWGLGTVRKIMLKNLHISDFKQAITKSQQVILQISSVKKQNFPMLKCRYVCNDILTETLFKFILFKNLYSGFS